MSCGSLEPKRLDFWWCDMCVIAEQVAQRRRREASNMAVINGWQRKVAGATDMGATRKRARFSGAVTGLEGYCPMWPKCAFGDQKGLI